MPHPGTPEDYKGDGADVVLAVFSRCADHGLTMALIGESLVKLKSAHLVKFSSAATALVQPARGVKSPS